MQNGIDVYLLQPQPGRPGTIVYGHYNPNCMSFVIATRAEVLKTKRTASVWLTVLGAGFITSPCFSWVSFKTRRFHQPVKAGALERTFYVGLAGAECFFVSHVHYSDLQPHPADRIQKQHLEAGICRTAIYRHHFLFQVSRHSVHDPFFLFTF